METAPNQETFLNPKEEAMYQKFIMRNPGITREDFKELRGYALNTKSPKVTQFYEVNGLIMQEKPTNDEISEISHDNLRHD